MKKNTLVVAGVASIATFAALSGIMIAQNASADERNTSDNHYEMFKEREGKFWGESFNEDTFNERYQVMLEEREAKRTEMQDKYNSSELSDYLGLDFDGMTELRDSEKTLSEYVSENNSDIDKVRELIKQEMLTHLNEELENGHIDQDKYDSAIENMESRIENRLNDAMDKGPRENSEDRPMGENRNMRSIPSEGKRGQF
ncbi:MAG: hypothetical protein Q9M91_08110 [Candidatus Dojkabacteria bacterium]|nr:hypothetical protein [Candidatus Dojkabacteria bacterium]MDQ7021744.1 hypothetical protein [Candidatus Dojkabacteria bacterium]